MRKNERQPDRANFLSCPGKAMVHYGASHKEAFEPMTREQVLKKLRDAIWLSSKGAGRQQRFASQLGISSAFLSAVLNGRKEPTESICKAIGVERVVIPQSITYRRATDKERKKEEVK